MIIKRAWTRKNGNINRPSLLHAMERFSPFIMLDLSEDEVALLNNEDDLITSVSLVGVADLRQQSKALSKSCLRDFFGDLPTFQSVERYDSCLEGFVS